MDYEEIIGLWSIELVSSLDKNPSNNSNLCRFDQSKRKSPCGDRSYAHAGKIKLSKFKVEKVWSIEIGVRSIERASSCKQCSARAVGEDGWPRSITHVGVWDLTCI